MVSRRSVLSAVLGASLANAPASAREREAASIELAPYVGRLKTIELTINGLHARLLFDTGAGFTSVTPAFAARLGLRPWGEMTGFRMTGERARFQRLANLPIGVGAFSMQREIFVFDLASLLPSHLPPIDGVAGLDLFEGRVVTLSHGLRQLRVENRSVRRRSSARMRICREAGGAGLSVFVPAASPLGDLWLLVDSGNLGGIRLSAAAHSALGGGSQLSLAVDGAAPVRVAPEVVEGLIYDGALDAGFISGHDVTIDLAMERIWWRSPG